MIVALETNEYQNTGYKRSGVPLITARIQSISRAMKCCGHWTKSCGKGLETISHMSAQRPTPPFCDPLGLKLSPTIIVSLQGIFYSSRGGISCPLDRHQMSHVLNNHRPTKGRLQNASMATIIPRTLNR